MKSLLTALQEGRLVELPDEDKEKALEYLANLIEAIPDIETEQDIYDLVLKREAAANTAIGMGVACPHVVGQQGSEVHCAVGWSPEGIDYGPKGSPSVHLIIMYYIPRSLRNVYLKELSGLTKAIQKSGGIQAIITADDIRDVRSQLLDWVGIAIDETIPDERARMIRLEAKSAAAESVATASFSKAPAAATFQIIPFEVVVSDQKPVILTQNAALASAFDRYPEVEHLLHDQTEFDLGDYRVLVRAASTFALDRASYECLAMKL